MFALRLLVVLPRETRSGLEQPQQLVDDDAEAMAAVLEDFWKRLQELLQARLGTFLPSTMTAYLALPLVLQAVNVTTVRGLADKRVETRKLEIYQRALLIQHSLFEGPDFIMATLDNILAYAMEDNLTSSTLASGHNEQSHASSRWPVLVRDKPRLLLRLLYRLDHMLCSIGMYIASKDELPQVLRQERACSSLVES